MSSGSESDSLPHSVVSSNAMSSLSSITGLELFGLESFPNELNDATLSLLSELCRTLLEIKSLEQKPESNWDESSNDPTELDGDNFSRYKMLPSCKSLCENAWKFH